MADSFLTLAQRAQKSLDGTEASAADFAKELSRRCGKPADAERLNVGDLYLAWAALERDPAAIAELDRRLKACAHKLTTDAVDDVLQLARQRLLVGEGHKPRLRSYSGEGALVKWLRTVLLSISIDASRKEKPDKRAGDDQLAARASAEVGADVRLMNARNRNEFNKAFAAALESLTSQEVTVLRMRFVDQMTLEEVAAAFGVHRRSAVRWMEAAFEKLLSETRKRIADRLKLRPAEIDSLLRGFEPSLADRLSQLLAPPT